MVNVQCLTFNDRKMKIKQGYVLREVCGRPVIMAEGLASIDFNRLLSLSESAAWLWQEAVRQGDFTVESLVSALCDEYDISLERAQADVARLVNQWQQEGVAE